MIPVNHRKMLSHTLKMEVREKKKKKEKLLKFKQQLEELKQQNKE